MKKSVLYLSAILLLAFAAQPAEAQFEGKIQYSSYEVSTDGNRAKVDDFTMYVTRDRIMLQGNNKYQFMGSLKTEGLLVRLDYEDFVFFAGEENAMKISKNDITSMMKMFDNNSSGRNLDETDINYEMTGEREKISGFETEKFIFRDTDEKNRHSVVWMTKDVDINWGMLGETWGNSTGNSLNVGFPTDLLFKEKYFPLRMENYRDEKLVGITEVTEISRTRVARAMVQVPSGVKVLSFQDYLFQKMSGN